MAVKPGELVGHVVSHTHWDRAWYLPFELFRLRLVTLVKKLLDIMERDTEYKFCFDGQTVPLEDHFEVCPEDRPRVERLVREGRLHVGPFYCLPDQYLISGESLIRNIAIGIRQAEALGRCQMEGMLSDVFGHPSQIPQILAGFGIPSAIFVRGLTAEDKERGWVQEWIAPDEKHSVTMYFLPGLGYASLYFWGMDSFDYSLYPTIPPDADEWSVELAEKHLMRAVEDFRKGGMTTGQLWLGNGVDHQEAQPHTGELVRILNERQDGIRLVHSTYEDMMNAVRAEKRRLPKIRGQFRLGLHGTMTSRVYQKQAYAKIASTIECLTEPLLALCDVYGRGHRAFRELGHTAYTLNTGQNWASFPYYPSGRMEYLWKLLLKNSPHDDICGCSVDATHQDMDNRFKRAAEIAGYLAADAMLVMASRIAEKRPDSTMPLIVAFNPHPFPLRDRLTTKVFLQGLKTARGLSLVDVEGRAVPFVVEDARKVDRHEWNGNNFLPEGNSGMEVTLAFLPEIEPCAFATFEIKTDSPGLRAATAKEAPASSMKGSSAVVENAFQKVTVHPNGTFDVLDKETGRKFSGLGLLEDVEDVGDEYTYTRFDKPGKPVTSRRAVGCVRILSHDELSSRVSVRFAMRLPKGLAADRTSRSKRTVKCPLCITIEIPHHRKGGRLKLAVTNNAKDHELFITFATGIRADRFGYDSKFDCDSYAVGEPVARIDSCVVVAEEGQGGRTAQAFGVVTECPTLAFTRSTSRGGVEASLSLVRAVDHVNHAIPVEMWPAHEGQCLRTIERTFEWTTGLHDAVRDECLKLRRTINTCAAVLPVTPWVKNRYFDATYAADEVPEKSLVSIEGRDVHLSCWKRSESGDGWAVRVYSLADKAQTCRIRVEVPVSECHMCNLAEKPEKKLTPAKGGGFAFRLGAKEIRTLTFTLDRQTLERQMKSKRDG